MANIERASPVRYLKCRELQLEIGTGTLIMGIVNVTPDSFSDGGMLTSIDEVVDQAHRLVAAGADMIDVGGESTRPGATIVSVDEELERVVPVITALKQSGLKVPISVDTYKSEVAEAALGAGAHIINDVWGLLYDERLAQVAAAYECPLIITHNRKESKPYNDVAAEVVSELKQQVDVAKKAGVKDEAIILDPGIGFAKSLTDNLQLMNRLRSIVALQYPVLLGTSRKSLIQRTLNLPSSEVLAGTLATLVFGVAQGCHIMRVHDVKEAYEAVIMADAIVREGGTNG